jgi:hypothetical protein
VTRERHEIIAIATDCSNFALRTTESLVLVRGEKNGMPVTGGIFRESKEFLLGYWIVDVATPERAYAIAGRISAAPGPGGAPTNMPIEVRRFAVYEQSKS